MNKFKSIAAKHNGDQVGLLKTIQSERLTSVDFVLDYLILGFDQRGALTTLVWPILLKDNEELVLGMDGYRDSLCELIERIVKNVEFLSDEIITIEFDNGWSLKIPLGEYKADGERAIFNAPNNKLQVW